MLTSCSHEAAGLRSLTPDVPDLRLTYIGHQQPAHQQPASNLVQPR